MTVGARRLLRLPAVGVAVMAVIAASVALPGSGDVSLNPFGIRTKGNPGDPPVNGV